MLKLDLKPKPHILKQFAFFGVVGLALIAFAILRLCGAWSFTHPAFLVASGIGVLQLVLFLVGVTVVTAWLYAGLMIVAFPIGFVLSQVLMAAIYYLVMTPIGLVFRLIGRDAMGRKLELSKPSYWHDRGPQRSPSSYFKLY
jgi:hypothetical protein